MCQWCNQRKSRVTKGGIGIYCDVCYDISFPDGVKGMREIIRQNVEFERRNR